MNRSSQSVGLIGMGLLGKAMAERMLQYGLTVVGYDKDPERCSQFTALGGRAVADAKAVVASAKVSACLLSLPDSQVVGQVVQQIESDLPNGFVIIDTTTGQPEASEQLADRLWKDYSVDFLDATVGGSSQQMVRGESILTVGGRVEAFAAQRPLLSVLSDKVFHVGPSGSGARMKLVVNTAIGLHRAVLAEALALARAFELDLEMTLAILKSSPAYSQAMDVKGHKMVQADFEPQARLSQHLKDVRLILEAGRQRKQTLPLSELHERLLQEIEDRGLGDRDNSVVVRAWFEDNEQ